MPAACPYDIFLPTSSEIMIERSNPASSLSTALPVPPLTVGKVVPLSVLPPEITPQLTPLPTIVPEMCPRGVLSFDRQLTPPVWLGVVPGTGPDEGPIETSENEAEPAFATYPDTPTHIDAPSIPRGRRGQRRKGLLAPELMAKLGFSDGDEPGGEGGVDGYVLLRRNALGRHDLASPTLLTSLSSVPDMAAMVCNSAEDYLSLEVGAVKLICLAHTLGPDVGTAN
jgi:hypothetical protein